MGTNRLPREYHAPKTLNITQSESFCQDGALSATVDMRGEERKKEEREKERKNSMEQSPF
jgi:hypothetical protein